MFKTATKTYNKSNSSSLFNKGKADSSFIQPKLNIGKPNDKYEVEADRVADTVVAKGNTTADTFFNPAPLVQKQKEDEVQTLVEPDNEIQQKSLVESITPLVSKQAEPLQEKEEQEEIQQKTEEEVQKKEAEEEIQQKSEEELQKKDAQEEIQQKAEIKEDQVQSKSDSHIVIPELQKQEEEIQKKDDQEEVQQKPEADVQKKEVKEDHIQPKIDNHAVTPELQKQEEEIQEKEEEEEQQPIQTKVNTAAGSDESGNSSVESRLNSSKGGGSPLPDGAKSQMESGFGTDFSNVRVHTDSSAVQMSKDLGAQAFTHGNDIYFNEGKFDTSSSSGQHLLAHELTHTVQQGATVQRKPEISQTSNTVQLLPDIIAGKLNEYARFIPGYTLFTVLIEYNPILGETVRRTPINVVEGLLELIPVWGVLLVDKLREYDVLQTAFDWINEELTRLNLTTDRIERLINEAWEDMDFVRFDPFDFNVGVLERTFTGLYNDVISFADSLKDQILEFIKDAVVSPLVGFLEENSPTYVLATKVIGSKFPLEDEVNAPTVEILEDFLVLIGKETEVEEMKNKGTLQETADWIDTQLITFFSLLGRFNALFTRAWDAFSLENLRDIPTVFSELLTDFTELLQDFLDFAAEVALKVLEIIKNALLAWLSSFADDIPGFHLLTVIIRINPFTGEAVARSTENIIRGFMGLVPGGEAKFQELQQTGVVTSAAQRIDALIARLGISVAFIVQLFTDIWDSLSIDDLISPIETFQRIAAQFGEPISRLFSFVVEVVKIIIELILAMMNFPTDLIQSIIANTLQAFNDIKRDPVEFLLNLIRAIKQGFVQFFNNFINHLLSGLQRWLFGELDNAGIQPPADITFQSILSMSMDVLGITVDNILERLALKIGQDKVDKIRAGLDMLTGIWTFIKDVIERGPIAIWEYIQEKISNLWSIIVDGVKGWIMTTIVTRVTTKLLSMLDPTGIMAVVNSAIAFFNAIQSFIEKLREMLEILNTFVAGIAELARGSITTAANYLETALADGIPVAISFLAKQVGLGNLGEKISEMIELAREKINEGIDWLIDKAMAAGTAFLNMLGLGGEEEEDAETPTGPISAAIAEINSEGEREKDEGEVTEEEAQGIKNKVNTDHASVINISSVTDGGDTWNYNYVQRAVEKIPKKTVEPTVIRYTPGKVVADPLTSDRSSGSRPGVLPGWAHAQTLNVVHDSWVRGHMLSEELGGTGSAQNLSIISKSINGLMETGPENFAKTATTATSSNPGKKLYYETTWENHPKSGTVENFAKTITVKIAEYNGDVRGPLVPYPFTQSAPPLTAAGVSFNINEIGRPTIVAQFKVSSNFALDILEAKATYGRFASVADLISKIELLYTSKGFSQGSRKWNSIRTNVTLINSNMSTNSNLQIS
ncbi:uncharacterized protein DUF4157 [Aquimarina sp. MAR_2010_214]|uniref:eCIS core domain-containing protein n=1 Tax=Aquimarina sp. MAR_2010_214 TaxID=1250026 RepID=UPI000C707A93|nr:DUF4157 domain-containing protein [Aquimarina sp. MAR_2010_214]PKV49127.1 uncharacterized protein DUF4157 [Aquimarina sp. MAR_2010_214]